MGLDRMQEARCDALGFDFDALVLGGVRKDGGKDNGAELTMRRRTSTGKTRRHTQPEDRFEMSSGARDQLWRAICSLRAVSSCA
jgi:hypothetical protein